MKPTTPTAPISEAGDAEGERSDKTPLLHRITEGMHAMHVGNWSPPADDTNSVFSAEEQGPAAYFEVAHPLPHPPLASQAAIQFASQGLHLSWRSESPRRTLPTHLSAHARRTPHLIRYESDSEWLGRGRRSRGREPRSTDAPLLMQSCMFLPPGGALPVRSAVRAQSSLTCTGAGAYTRERGQWQDEVRSRQVAVKPGGTVWPPRACRHLPVYGRPSQTCPQALIPPSHSANCHDLAFIRLQWAAARGAQGILPVSGTEWDAAPWMRVQPGLATLSMRSGPIPDERTPAADAPSRPVRGRHARAVLQSWGRSVKAAFEWQWRPHWAWLQKHVD